MDTKQSLSELIAQAITSSFPQVENLAGFKREGKSIEIFETREDVQPFTVFGVRACDARSFEILDKVFLKEPVDTFYASRREMGTVITLACTKPDETCFCRSFGIDPADPAGADQKTWSGGAHPRRRPYRYQ